MREIAAYHGYTQSRGETAGQGSTFAFTLAIIHGDVQTTSFDEDELRRIVPWLEQHSDALGGMIGELAAQIGTRLTTLPEMPTGDPSASVEPIDTLDG